MNNTIISRIMILTLFLFARLIDVSPASALGPILATPTVTNIGANQTTLQTTSSVSGRGYFTLLNGSSTDCGTGAQVQAGQTATGGAAPYHGSLSLSANVTASYTIRNLTQNTTYTACVTADDGVTVQGVPVATSFATTPITSVTTPAWIPVGTTDASFNLSSGNSLGFDPAGTPYLVYLSSQISAVKYDGSAWVPVGNGIVSAGNAYYPSLTFAPDGTPYVAYEDSSSPYYGITVMKYDGTAWVQVGNRAFAPQGSSASLAFASDGTPYVAFRDNSGSSSYIPPDITVMKFTGTAWVVVGTQRFFSSSSFSAANLYHSYYNGKVSLALDRNDTPYVAFDYTNGNTDGAVVMKFDGTTWTPVGSNNIATGGVDWLSLAISADGYLYVGFTDTGSTGVSKATVLKFDGLNWLALGSTRFTTGNSVAYTTLAMSPDNTPYLAVTDGTTGKADVMKFDGTSWITVGPASFSLGGMADPSLVFAPDGAPYFACTDMYDYFTTVWKLGNRPLAILQTALPGGFTGIAYGATLTTDIGVAPLKWSVSSLPAGLSLDAATGVISGVPTTASSSTVTVQVTDAAGNSAAKTFTLLVVSNLAVSSATLPNGAVGAAYSQALAGAGGYGAYTWSLSSGALPPGLTLAASGVISGIPTAAATSSFTVLVTDGGGNSAGSATLSITVAAPALSISTTSLAGGTVSTAYSQTLTAAGGTAPYTWSISSGTLPTGLTINTSTGLISGTPTKAATSTFTVKVTDSNKATATKALSIVVAAAKPDLVITAVSGPTAITRGTTKYTFTATVKNQGTASAAASTLGFYLSTDTAIATTDKQVGTVSVTTLAAGASKSVTLSVAVPTTVTAGTYYVGALADSKAVVAESNETNNGLAMATSIAVK